MKGMLLRGVVRPLIERLGTMLAAYLIARGVDSDQAAQLINYLVAALFIVVDLAAAAVNRYRDETRLIGHNGGPSLRDDL